MGVTQLRDTAMEFNTAAEQVRQFHEEFLKVAMRATIRVADCVPDLRQMLESMNGEAQAILDHIGRPPDYIFSPVASVFRPMVYVFFAGDLILYIGLAKKGLGRPFDMSHHQNKNLLESLFPISLAVWACPTVSDAVELEKQLIRRFKPIWNRNGDLRKLPDDECVSAE